MGMEGLSDLLSSLSPDDMASLKAAASNLLGGNQDGAKQNSQEETPSKKEDSGMNFSKDDMAMLMRVRSMMSKMNQKDDRSDLILALKPHLSPRRQKRAEEAVRMMHMMELLPSLKDIF